VVGAANADGSGFPVEIDGVINVANADEDVTGEVNARLVAPGEPPALDACLALSHIEPRLVCGA
jgi:hypothetical protein